MRLTTAILLTLLAGPAMSHPGHLVDVAGHGHWVGAAAIGLAILIGLIGSKTRNEENVESEAEEAEESAA